MAPVRGVMYFALHSYPPYHVDSSKLASSKSSDSSIVAQFQPEFTKLQQGPLRSQTFNSVRYRQHWPYFDRNLAEAFRAFSAFPSFPPFRTIFPYFSRPHLNFPNSNFFTKSLCGGENELNSSIGARCTLVKWLLTSIHCDFCKVGYLRSCTILVFYYFSRQSRITK